MRTAAAFFAGDLRATLAPLAALGGVGRFEIEGAGGGTFVVDLATGAAVAADAQPSCIVRAHARDFLALVEGRMSAADATITSRVRCSGEAARTTALLTALAGAARPG
jgi:hypothetical protein